MLIGIIIQQASNTFKRFTIVNKKSRVAFETHITW